MGWALSINTSDIASARLDELSSRALEPGEVRIDIKRFALTANNITYAAFGEAMKYWDFFPTEEGRGHLPVWGFGEIAESRLDELKVGERIYGYFPAASELIVQPDRIKSAGFTDVAAHRQSLPPVYNNYNRCQGDPGYEPEHENEQMVLQPLFVTSFLIDAYLKDQAFFGATIVSLTSASSKTALSLAWMLASETDRTVEIEALTSPGNIEFVQSTGLYDRVVSYEEVDGLSPEPPRLIVDFAGSADLNRRLHTMLQSSLKGNIRVGGAHWDDSEPARDLPGPRPEFFFAPDHVVQRRKEWGIEGYVQRYSQSWLGFATASKDYFNYETHTGSDGALEIYNALVAGNFDPQSAFLIKND